MGSDVMQPFYLTVEYWVGVVLTSFVITLVVPYFKKYVIDKLLSSVSKRSEEKQKEKFIQRHVRIEEMVKYENIFSYRLAMATQSRVVGFLLFVGGMVALLISVHFAYLFLDGNLIEKYKFIAINILLIIFIFGGFSILKDGNNKLDEIKTAMNIINVNPGGDNGNESDNG